MMFVYTGAFTLDSHLSSFQLFHIYISFFIFIASFWETPVFIKGLTRIFSRIMQNFVLMFYNLRSQEILG